MADVQRTSSRRPHAAILLPAAGHATHACALDLARRVAANGWDVMVIEPRSARTAALRDAGPEQGVCRFTLDVPGDGHRAFFGCTPAEQLVAQLFVDRQIDVVHAHLAGDLVVVPLLERAWLLGIPLVVTVHNGWSPIPGASAAVESLPAGPDGAALAERLLRDVVSLADLVCAPDAGTAEAVAGAGWTDEPPRVVEHAGSGGGQWTDLYGLLAGEPDPPRTALTLSAIVTTYQRHTVLRDCLEALGNQTLPHDRFEVLVVDDASEPSAGPVVEAFRDRLDVTFVRLGRNVGLGEARNVGVEASHGDVLLFLDDDDEPAPRCLAEHLRTHAEHGDQVQAVLGWTGPTADRAASVDAWLAFRSGLYISHWMRHLAVLDWFAFWGGRSSIRRGVLGDERFELPFLEDADLGYRLSHRGLRVAHNRHAVQRVRIGLDAASLLRRSGRLGQARANMAHHHPQVQDNHCFSPDRYARELAAALPERASARLRTLTAAMAAPLESLRATADPDGDGSQLERLAADLHTASTAEAALGWALGGRRIAAREAGRPLRIGVSVSSPLLPELVSELGMAPPHSAVLVVAAPPGMSRARLDAALDPLRTRSGGLQLQPLACGSATELWQACDLVASVNPPMGHDPARHALPLPRGPVAESLRRLLYPRDLVGSFR